jgi:hypothetical protein
MRNLPLFFALLLLSVLLAAASAQASLLPVPTPAQPFVVADEEEAESGEDEEGEEAEEECVIEDEEDEQLCAEIAHEEEESEAAERCVLESASASVDASRSGKVQITVRYSTYEPSSFSLRYSLRGSKGALNLGTAKAKFGRAGTFHDIVRVEDRKLPKVLAAREFQVELQAQKTPGSCRERLTVQRRGAGRAHRP